MRSIVLIALLAACPAHALPSAPDLAWLAGSWCGGEGGERVEETWLAPVGGESMGMSRTVKDGRATAFEFIRIARVDGVLTYLAQPGGSAATAFRAKASGADWIRFENPDHDFPTKIAYRREGAGLVAEIAGPGRDGTERVVAYRYRRCPSAFTAVG